jgi:hypothetical protein
MKRPARSAIRARFFVINHRRVDFQALSEAAVAVNTCVKLRTSRAPPYHHQYLGQRRGLPFPGAHDPPRDGPGVAYRAMAKEAKPVGVTIKKPTST